MTRLHFRRTHNRKEQARVFNEAIAESDGKSCDIDASAVQYHKPNDDECDNAAAISHDYNLTEDACEEDAVTSGSRHFGTGILNLIGKRSHDVQEFMSRIRAQDMSQAYEQSKTSDFELNKLPAATNKPVGSASFGPCMTYKQAVERIQEQQLLKREEASHEESMPAGKDKEKGARFQESSFSAKQHTRQGAFNLTKRPSQDAWKVSEVEQPSKSFQRKMTVDTVAMGSHSLSSQASVAPTEPESPMSCYDLSVFC